MDGCGGKERREMCNEGEKREARERAIQTKAEIRGEEEDVGSGELPRPGKFGSVNAQGRRPVPTACMDA